MYIVHNIKFDYVHTRMHINSNKKYLIHLFIKIHRKLQHICYTSMIDRMTVKYEFKSLLQVHKLL